MNLIKIYVFLGGTCRYQSEEMTGAMQVDTGSVRYNYFVNNIINYNTTRRDVATLKIL